MSRRRRRQTVENYNYHNDYRVKAQDKENFLVIDEETMTCTIDIDDPVFYNDDGEKIKLPCEFEVCPTCRGNGKHTNPSVDAGGIPERRFRRDPEFAESYHRGDYDVECYECGGKRVVPRPVARNDKHEEMLEEYHDFLQSYCSTKQMQRAEKRMGA